MSTVTAPKPRRLYPIILPYARSLLAATVALIAAWPLNRAGGGDAALIFLFPALVFSALYCGVGPSISTTILSLIALRYWFIEPIHSFRAPGRAESLEILAFILAVGFIFAIAEVHCRNREILRRAQKELDDRVKERTVELDTANSRLRQLTARLLQLQDDERRRFARELHDSLGQNLAALSMNLSMVHSDIDRMTKTTSALADSEALVQEMSKEIRTVSHLLHPPLLDEAGLLSALRWYVEGFAQRSNIDVELDIAENFGRLPRELETAVFRVVQECLTNIHRHSGSSTAKIRVARSRDEVLVEVADSGKGISTDKQEELATMGAPGVGIAGMRERLRQLNGSLEINSSRSGTLVTVRLPISAASTAAA